MESRRRRLHLVCKSGESSVDNGMIFPFTISHRPYTKQIRKEKQSHLPLVPAPTYINLPPSRIRSATASIASAITGMHIATASATEASSSLIKRHRSRVETRSMLTVRGLRPSVCSVDKSISVMILVSACHYPFRDSHRERQHIQCHGHRYVLPVGSKRTVKSSPRAPHRGLSKHPRPASRPACAFFAVHVRWILRFSLCEGSIDSRAYEVDFSDRHRRLAKAEIVLLRTGYGFRSCRTNRLHTSHVLPQPKSNVLRAKTKNIQKKEV